MERLARAKVTVDRGVEDDFRGRSRGRNVVVMTREGWEAACHELSTESSWTTRRANLLVEGVDLSDQTGRRLRVGDVTLQITGECDPCARMDEALPGLRKALEPDWRAGAMCVVVEPGEIAVGDTVELLQAG